MGYMLWRHQAITWTIVDLSSVTPFGIKLGGTSQKLFYIYISTMFWTLCIWKYSKDAFS